jgi:hypothetical protein
MIFSFGWAYEMGEDNIHNVLELAKNNQLQYLQWKVEYLTNDIDMRQVQRRKPLMIYKNEE